ncbi:MAG: DUF2637 domain-containing protein [Actinopolymorphaceae bacterium]
MDTTTVDVATAVQNDARQAYRQSVNAGTPLTGRELGEMFSRGERWGRARITEVRTADAARHNGNGQVNEPEPPGVALGAASPREMAQDGMPAASDRQPAGARLVAWSGFLLGVAASVAANVAHAQPGIGPRIAGAFVPLALLLAVECMTRPRWNRRPGTWSTWWWGLARYGGTGLVALVAAVMSYRHMSALLTGYGEDALNAAIGPLAVDGLMVVAGFALLAMSNPHTDKENDS